MYSYERCALRAASYIESHLIMDTRIKKDLPCFREYLKNSARSAAKFEVPAQNLKIHRECNFVCVQILTSQVKKSAHQVRSKSGAQLGTNFKLEDRALGTVLVWMFSNFQNKYWSGYLQNVCFRCFILVTSDQVNFRPGPIITLWGNYSFALNF